MSLLDVRRSWRLLVAVSVIIPAGLAAQSAPAYTVADSTAAAPAASAAQPTPTAAPLALAIAPSGATTRAARPDSTETQRLAAATARMQDDDTRVGKNLALVLVGAAGVVVGALVGDTEGTVIAVGGAAIALYGLYRWLR
jgi:hypothetical protein